MKKDDSPVSQTCPDINDIISTLKEIYACDEPMTKSELKNLEDTMEKLRKANSDLRDWGNNLYEELCEAEKDRDYYKDKVEELEDEVDSLKKEVDRLENELSDSQS